jgi:hypothetical protein
MRAGVAQRRTTSLIPLPDALERQNGPRFYDGVMPPNVNDQTAYNPHANLDAFDTLMLYALRPNQGQEQTTIRRNSGGGSASDPFALPHCDAQRLEFPCRGEDGAVNMDLDQYVEEKRNRKVLDDLSDKIKSRRPKRGRFSYLFGM